MIEMVPLAERMAMRAERIEAGVMDVDKEEDTGKSSGSVKGVGMKEGDSGGGGEVFRDAIFFRLDGLGYRVGQGLSERYVRTVFLQGERGEGLKGRLSHWTLWTVRTRTQILLITRV